MKKWTKKETEIAIHYHEMGMKFNEIGINLGRTKKSIKEKLNKLGFNDNIINYHITNICENCGNSFNALKSEKRRFCSQSCSAKTTNKEKTNYRYCEICKKTLNSVQKTCCSYKCQHESKKNNIYYKIKNGISVKFVGNVATQSRWHKNYLIHKYGEKCMKCGWNEKHSITNKVPIELEHKDGNSENNSLDNLELLCPNCHSLTPTYKALNKGNGRHSRMVRYKEGKSF